MNNLKIRNWSVKFFLRIKMNLKMNIHSNNLHMYIKRHWKFQKCSDCKFPLKNFNFDFEYTWIQQNLPQYAYDINFYFQCHGQFSLQRFSKTGWRNHICTHPRLENSCIEMWRAHLKRTNDMKRGQTLHIWKMTKTNIIVCTKYRLFSKAREQILYIWNPSIMPKVKILCADYLISN